MKNKKISALLLSAALGLCTIGCSGINIEDPDPSNGGSSLSEKGLIMPLTCTEKPWPRGIKTKI